MRSVGHLFLMLSLFSLPIVVGCGGDEAEVPPTETTTFGSAPTSAGPAVEVRAAPPSARVEARVEAVEAPSVTVAVPRPPTVVVQPPSPPSVTVTIPRPPSVTITPPSVEVQ